MKTHSLIALALALVVPAAFAQRDFSNVEIKVIPVAKNIFMLEGSGGNIGVSIGSDGNLIVDDQFAPLSEKIDAALQKLNPGKLRFVLNTHHHGDHTGGNAAFGAKEATIIAQTNVRKRLASEASAKKEGLPVITFDQSASVHFNGGFPFIDLNSGGSVEGYIKTVAAVLEKIPADAEVIPGHGKLGTVDDLKNFHAMLVETTGLLKQGIADGKSLADLKAAGLPEKFKDFGTGFIKTDRWIETIYNSAAKK